MKAIEFKRNRLWYLDQAALPGREVWRECRNIEDGYQALKRLSVRGAPLIGVFAAYCICVGLEKFSSDKKKFLEEFDAALDYLRSCRPTAVNLAWALGRLRTAVKIYAPQRLEALKKAIIRSAAAIHKEDIRLCERMARFGAKLVKRGDRILTHCNTGFLATAGMGTALAVITRAHTLGKNIKVYVDETRPLLQGARLTAWELQKEKVPYQVIADNTAAYLMQQGLVDKVFVGADRIAANGDAANKIGTYNLAIVADYHKVPFYVVAPFSTFDLGLPHGSYVPIEERRPDEVRTLLGKAQVAPENSAVRNPAFDVTPHQLITAIVSDKGIIYPPYRKNIRKVMKHLIAPRGEPRGI